MKIQKVLSLMLLLLIAATLPSCKSPTATTESSAFTLILPDSTVAWGDSAMMRVVSSKPLSSSSVYTWSFGDSSTLLSRDDTIIHYYLDTGVFTVKVDLKDTSNKSQLGIQAGTVNVTARHFNLALLQSMPYVDVTWNANVGRDTIQTQPILCRYCGFVDPVPFSFINPLWNGVEFDMNESSGFNYGYSATGMSDTGSAQVSVAGSVDPTLTQLVGFSDDTNTYYFYADSYTDPNFFLQTYQSSFRVNDIPFKSESDTDVVFEGIGKTLSGAIYTSSLFSNGGNMGQLNVQSQFNQVFSVIIRFHK
jgi:PKD domain